MIALIDSMMTAVGCFSQMMYIGLFRTLLSLFSERKTEIGKGCKTVDSIGKKSEC